ncbi:molybdate transport system ATP-binding protein [Streptomyces sp. 1222.5]|uniref:ABC transporter ATP-binding protein n=1 Tax=unclassified Streptomyces TaxID=2593676 RepID=UPI000898BBC7|nr:MULTISPECIES: ABC transporter ATP-binding protein [unclassified Streptomyces]PKW06441.1 molybdate transport system ATP-binding protein [Streptomyces sp. 5112.2]SED12904.1 molybdate transport system ATP-binding protein [Streptomyces sp. 1222.5]
MTNPFSKTAGDAEPTGERDAAPVREPSAAAAPPQEPPARGAGLDAHLVVDRSAFRLDVALTAVPGEVVALLGPNGAGKTTALRALAGLVPLTGGHLRLDGTALERTPPEDRPVGVVFQDYLLFPHLSALDNVAFGPRCQGVSKAEARAQAAAWLERMGLADHAAAKPRRLSGGQAQRVAVARALATRPRLLLLDEPLAALDARTRLEVRAQLRRHLAEFEAVAVLVTHDPLDAMVLADRLVVVEHGRVVQQGTPSDIARHPRTDYIAQLVGLNLYRGRADRHTVRLDAGPSITTTEDLSGPVFVAFPPSAVTLFRDRPTGASARNVWRCEVTGLETHGDQIRADLTGELPLAADLTTVAAAELGLHPGAPVWATVKATQTHAYPA